MRKLFLGIFFFFLCVGVSAHFFDGRSVCENDGVLRLCVYPHTATDPFKDFSQYFLLKNLTASDINNVWAAYVFSEPITNKDILKWHDANWDWMPASYQCNSPNKWAYIMNQDTDRNPHYGWCYYTSDNNTPGNPADDYNTTVFAHEFKSWSLPLKTIYWDEWTQVEKGYLSSIKNAFEYAGYHPKYGGYVWKLKNSQTIQANERILWMNNYKTTAVAGEWFMVIWSGTENCLLNDSCDYVLKLDPWFSSAYQCKFKVNLDTGFTGSPVVNPVVLFAFDPTTVEGIVGDVNCVFNVDGSDFAPVNQLETKALDFNFEGKWSHTRVDAWIKLDDYNGEDASDWFWVYFKNPAAVSAGNAANTWSDYNLVYLFDEENGSPIINDETALNNDGTYIGAPILGGDGNVFHGYNGSIVSSKIITTTRWQGIAGQTVLFWATTPAITDSKLFGALSASGNYFASFNDGGSDRRLRYYLAQPAGTSYFDFKSESVAASSSHWIAFTCGSLGAHIVVDNNYISGVDVNTACPSTVSADYCVGSRCEAGQNWANKLDSFRVLNRQASQDELRVIFESENRKLISSIGATEVFPFDRQPDVNVVYPNGGESFDKRHYEVMDINLSLRNDQNWVLLDVNYSTSNVQGTGTPILSDYNTGAIGDFNRNVVFSYDWNFSAVADNNYFILAVAKDDTNSKFDASNAFFTLYTSPDYAPDVNVVYPNGGERFDKRYESVADINLSIWNDQNWVLVDLNYSVVAVPGTGTPILSDYNTGALGDFSQNFVFSYDWNFSAVPDETYYVLARVRDNSGNKTDASDATFVVFRSFNLPPLVEVVYPNGGEVINLGSNPIVEVRVRVTNDDNWVSLDLDYSFNPIVGGGIELIDDENTATSPDVTCQADYNDANVGSLCIFYWDATFVPDGNYYIIASVVDDNGTMNWDVSDGDFNLFSFFTPPFDINSTYSRYFSPDDPRRDNVTSIDKFDYFLYIFMIFGAVVIGGIIIILMRG